MTNFEKIKEMNLEDLAWFLYDVFQHNLEKEFLRGKDAFEFLRNEVEVVSAKIATPTEVIDDFAKRLLDAFPEANIYNRCPALYYDDFRDIVEEVVWEMKGEWYGNI